MEVTVFYAGLLGLLYGTLALLVVRQRNRAKHLYTASETSDILLKRLIRGHANLGEYVPYILLMMFFIEARQTPDWIVHIIGAVLVLSRLLHAYAFTQPREVLACRVSGTAITLTLLFCCGLYCTWLGLS